MVLLATPGMLNGGTSLQVRPASDRVLRQCPRWVRFGVPNPLTRFTRDRRSSCGVAIPTTWCSSLPTVWLVPTATRCCLASDALRCAKQPFRHPAAVAVPSQAHVWVCVWWWPPQLDDGESVDIKCQVGCKRRWLAVHVPKPCCADTLLRPPRVTPLPLHRAQVENLSFSGHADSKGIMQFMRQIQPQHVVLVHGQLLPPAMTACA